MQLGERLGRRVVPSPGLLRGYQRVFRGRSRKWNGGVASLERKAGAITYGAIVALLEEDLVVLDRFEGVATGNYRREELLVEPASGPGVLAMTYISNSLIYNEPTRAYLEQVARTVGQVWTSDPPVTWRSFPLR